MDMDKNMDKIGRLLEIIKRENKKSICNKLGFSVSTLQRYLKNEKISALNIKKIDEFLINHPLEVIEVIEVTEDAPQAKAKAKGKGYFIESVNGGILINFILYFKGKKCEIFYIRNGVKESQIITFPARLFGTFYLKKEGAKKSVIVPKEVVEILVNRFDL